MIDVLFITLDDNANTGWRFFKCAQMLGLKVMGFKGVYHPFLYPEQFLLHPELAKSWKLRRETVVKLEGKSELQAMMEHARIIHFIASTCIFTELNLLSKPVVMQHGGRTYRSNPKQLNELFNQFCDAAIIQCPDLLNLGARNEKLIYYPVDTNFIQPSFGRAGKKLVIGHFPSQPTEKGYEAVQRVIARLREVTDKFEFRTIRPDGGKLIWLDALDRVNDCDLIIDVFAAKTAAGLKYGTWGNASIEAAALGKVVVTMSLYEDIYKEEYGDCALNITNTEEKLLEVLSKFIEMPHAELYKEKERTRAWVEEKHSMEATAIRLLPIYKNIVS